jgi:hypothetical protein
MLWRRLRHILDIAMSILAISELLHINHPLKERSSSCPPASDAVLISSSGDDFFLRGSLLFDVVQLVHPDPFHPHLEYFTGAECMSFIPAFLVILVISILSNRRLNFT